MKKETVMPTTEIGTAGPCTMNDFRSRGIAVADWARERGFSAHLVYAVLAGRRKCLRGQSHQLAKELGMK